MRSPSLPGEHPTSNPVHPRNDNGLRDLSTGCTPPSLVGGTRAGVPAVGHGPRPRVAVCGGCGEILGPEFTRRDLKTGQVWIEGHRTIDCMAIQRARSAR